MIKEMYSGDPASGHLASGHPVFIEEYAELENLERFSSFNHACFTGDIDKVINKLAKVEKQGVNVISFINEPDPSLGKGSLHYAAAGGHIDIVTYLINAGANVNGMDSEHRTPLFFAVYGRHVDVVEYLISAGTNINHRYEYTMKIGRGDDAEYIDFSGRVIDDAFEQLCLLHLGLEYNISLKTIDDILKCIHIIAILLNNGSRESNNYANNPHVTYYTQASIKEKYRPAIMEAQVWQRRKHAVMAFSRRIDNNIMNIPPLQSTLLTKIKNSEMSPPRISKVEDLLDYFPIAFDDSNTYHNDDSNEYHIPIVWNESLIKEYSSNPLQQLEYKLCMQYLLIETLRLHNHMFQFVHTGGKKDKNLITTISYRTPRINNNGENMPPLESESVETALHAIRNLGYHNGRKNRVPSSENNGGVGAALQAIRNLGYRVGSKRKSTRRRTSKKPDNKTPKSSNLTRKHK